MRTKTPLQEKTPFAIDAKPMEGLLTARAGLAVISRAFRSLGAPALCDAQVRIKKRERGFTVGQQVESLVLLHAAGGDCMQDIEPLRKDGGVTKMLGYAAPGQRCVADFLESFHDPEKVAQARAGAAAGASVFHSGGDAGALGLGAGGGRHRARNRGAREAVRDARDGGPGRDDYREPQARGAVGL